MSVGVDLVAAFAAGHLVAVVTAPLRPRVESEDLAAEDAVGVAGAVATPLHLFEAFDEAAETLLLFALFGFRFLHHEADFLVLVVGHRLGLVPLIQVGRLHRPPGVKSRKSRTH